MPVARLGLGYRVVCMKTLMDVVGPADAKEIFFTGRMFSAQEALGVGLINRVVPDAESTPMSTTIASASARRPLTVRCGATIEELTRLDGSRISRGQRRWRGRAFLRGLIEGRTAFMEKRRPQFKGR